MKLLTDGTDIVEKGRIRVIGHDPGSRNYAYSVVDARVWGHLFQYKVRKCGIIEKAIPALKDDLKEGTVQFIKEVDGIIGDFKPVNYFIAERFVSRGLRGDIGERANIMLGIALALTTRKKVGVVETPMITASTWKNRTKKILDLKELYKQCRVPPHEVDATLIALFIACQHFKIKPYSFFKSVKHVRKFVDRVESATTSKHRNIRPKKSFDQCFVH